ncbi:MAG: acyl-CoA/acyl-ACP dehydrogenase [Sphingomonadaceae bacterium]|uniref:acyl-CoA dehydrogenase family protein n=1 Tax=Thermaurantiacus sp. TaxID=2820283 RepID=UPI00298ED9E1|nr:acyl-CoA dehydrogenase family protein [Thermaurantiacus sp.]MCS6987034.1 acyl-CoA/acyl-ACP dehydrogenase [Sphingomonadaceae bacterium]MDW8415628.1 acyl-CoA dehydrogenase family protein [Thermaurantiacus sp.]
MTDPLPVPEEPDHVGRIRATVARFVADHCPPAARRAWDQAMTWPREVWAAFRALGFTALTVPPEHGGTGVDIPAALAVVEELSRAGPFLAGPYIHAAFYGGLNLAENGSAEQKAHWLPRLARGEAFLAYGLSEPDVGGDLASVTTRAERDGDSIRVTGVKRWCTGADWADAILTLVRSGPANERKRNLSFLLIPADARGVRLSPLAHANLRYSGSFDVVFDDVRVPEGAVLGGPSMWNRGWEQLVGRALAVERLEIAAVALGMARAALDEALAYARQRVQFGQPIARHQAIRHRLADAAARLAAARAILAAAARAVQAGQDGGLFTSMAKLFVTETALEVGLACQRVLGAYGLSDGFDMERNVRDLLGMPIVGGSSDMQRNNVAALLGL